MRGAYGVGIAGVCQESRLVALPEDGKELCVEVSQHTGPAEAGATAITERRAHIRIPAGGRLVLQREPARARYECPDPLEEDELVHPGLSPVGVMFAHWQGREAFHAGGFVVDGRVWGLLGGHGSGKSTTLAGLAGAGVEVMTDDVLVIQGRTAFAGPRCIDLRPDAARQVEHRTGLPVRARASARRRLSLAQTKCTAPVAGWVELRWGRGHEVETERVPPSSGSSSSQAFACPVSSPGPRTTYWSSLPCRLSA